MVMRRYGRLATLFWTQVMLVDFYRVLFIHSQFQLLALLFMAGATFAPSLKVFAGIYINLLSSNRRILLDILI